ncbi:hypothetical protein HAX54_045811, partial [Datura stramonium]|nr:hypothetical protein [Datura stramonium]
MPQISMVNPPGTCTFTQEQYEQILQMLNKNICLTTNMQGSGSRESTTDVVMVRVQ